MEMKPGDWHFGVKCAKCGSFIAFAHDRVPAQVRAGAPTLARVAR